MPILLLPASPGVTFPADWQYKRLITVDHTKVSADLTDFPVLVKLTASNHTFAHAQANGYDVRFTAADGTTLLAFERERYDSTGQVAEFWVKLPAVSSTVDTTFWMFYGCATVGDGATPAAVWSNGFLGVFHLKEDPTGTAPQHIDSTGRGGDATAVNLVAGDQSAGQIAGALTFDGTSKRLTTANSLSVQGLSAYTIEAWVNPSLLNGVKHDVYEEPRGATSNVTRMKLAVETTNTFTFQGRDTDAAGLATWATNATALSTGTWYYVAGVFDSVADSHSLTVNASRTTNALAAAAVASTAPLSVPKVGSRADATTEFWPGQIDELRISNVARSNAWVDASYASGASTLLAVGSEQATAGPTFTGTAPAALTSSASVAKVAKVTAVASLVGTGTATARKVMPATARSALAGTSSGTVRKVAPAVGASPLAATAAGTARKVAPAVGVGQLADTATSTVRKVARPLGVAPLALPATLTAVKVARPSSSAPVAATAAGTVRKVAVATGRAAAAATSTTTVRKVAVAGSSAPLAMPAAVTGRKVATPSSSSPLVAASRVTAAKVARPTSSSPLAIPASVTARKVQGVTGRLAAALTVVEAGFPVRPVIVVATLAGTATGQAVKVATAAVRAAFAGTAAASTTKRAPAVGVSTLGLAARAPARKVLPVTGAAGLTTTSTAAAARRALPAAVAGLALTSLAPVTRRAIVTARAALTLEAALEIRHLVTPGDLRVTGDPGTLLVVTGDAGQAYVTGGLQPLTVTGDADGPAASADEPARMYVT